MRGKIIKMLLESPGMDIENLVQNLGGEKIRVLRLLGVLEKEGFLTKKADRIAIPSR